MMHFLITDKLVLATGCLALLLAGGGMVYGHFQSFSGELCVAVGRSEREAVGETGQATLPYAEAFIDLERGVRTEDILFNDPETALKFLDNARTYDAAHLPFVIFLTQVTPLGPDALPVAQSPGAAADRAYKYELVSIKDNGMEQKHSMDSDGAVLIDSWRLTEGRLSPDPMRVAILNAEHVPARNIVRVCFAVGLGALIWLALHEGHQEHQRRRGHQDAEETNSQRPQGLKGSFLAELRANREGGLPACCR